MYGSVVEEQKNPNDAHPLVNFNTSTHNVNISDDFDPDFPFDEEDPGDSFWRRVRELYSDGNNGHTRAKAQRIARIERLQEKIGDKNDLLVYLLTVVHDRYDAYCKSTGKAEKYPTFVFEISEFASIIIEQDAVNNKEKPKYKSRLEMEDGSKKTILHLAAERNLVQVAESIIECYPNIVYVTTNIGEDVDIYPLTYALQKWHDEVASALIHSMENESVRNFFEDTPIHEAYFKFKDYINHGNMKKTVLAVLDCLMNPDWPFIPVNENDNETKEGVYANVPNMPIRYHFYYRLLDGDDEGRCAKDEDGVENDEFNPRSKSCLQLLVDSESKEDAVRHPVVRLLVRRKWDNYGSCHLKIHFLFYLIFLAVLSLAFFLQTDGKDHMKYSSRKDYFRMICEILTLLFTLIYIVSEVDQAEKEGLRKYSFDPFNWFDIGGMGLLLAIIPLRYTDSTREEMAVSSAAFIINFLRVFKYFSAFKQLGLYSKTFATIIYQDISKFAVVFFIVMFAFTGGVYMALKASGGLSNIGGFWQVLLQEVRALAETQGFADDYSKYYVVVVILLMVNMFCVMVVLMNILIGQISYRYEVALQTATISYDICRTKIVTRIENSRFPKFNARIAYYKDGDFVSEEDVETELIEDWLALKKSSSSAEKNRQAVKEMMNTKVKRLPPRSKKADEEE